MTVYVDNARVRRGKAPRRSHMAADSLMELHRFAVLCCIARCWYHSHPEHPHYDVNDNERAYALRLGALAVDSRELLRRSKDMR